MKTSIKNILKNTDKYIASVASLITIDDYIKKIKDQNLRDKYESQINRNNQLEDQIVSLLENQISEENNKNKIIEIVSRRSNSLDIVRNDVTKIQEISNNLNNTNINDQIRENLTNQLNQQVNKLNTDINEVNNNLDKLIEIITKSSSSNNFNESINDIHNYLNLYKEYLTTLNIDQLYALSHISISIFILFCLWSIISLFYGNYLIKYFNLETKFPKLAKFIKIRQQFQLYNFIFNVILIMIALLLIIYINIFTLIYK